MRSGRAALPAMSVLRTTSPHRRNCPCLTNVMKHPIPPQPMHAPRSSKRQSTSRGV